MTTVLVVDDSAVDREWVGGLLRREGRLTVDLACDGAEALARLDRALPDLVVTDLVMPQMDGLELVSAVRRKYPIVPVILMTCRGSEEIAVRALEEGAASYVPKRVLAKRMLDTVSRVLTISRQQRNLFKLMERMTTNECCFVLENDCSLIAPLVGYLQECVIRMGVCDEADRTRVGVAVEEALVNALYHGNLQVDSELRERDDSAFTDLAQKRCGESPYQDRRIHVQASLSRQQAVFLIRDEGPGFDPQHLPDPTDPANLEKAAGRGILLMRTFMDDVEYNDAGNVVRMTKRCQNATIAEEQGD